MSTYDDPRLWQVNASVVIEADDAEEAQRGLRDILGEHREDLEHYSVGPALGVRRVKTRADS